MKRQVTSKTWLITACIILFGLIAGTGTGQISLWDMTNLGGNGSGVIFKTDADGGNQSVEYAFGDNPGMSPQYIRLCEASNGKLYGMTSSGGATGTGVLFEYDIDAGAYTKLLDFGGTARGSSPQGRLIEATSGKLYGMTSSGGSNSYGVIFEYDYTTSTFTKKLDFDGTATGRNPYGGLVLASNGMLYGMTRIGGTSNLGVLFEYDYITSTYTKKFDFDGATNGSNPCGNLVEASNRNLYGLTRIGGANELGVLFEYDYNTDTFTNKFDFDGATIGSSPYGSLVEADNGKLYGLTYSGGSYNYGVLFDYDPSNDNYNAIFEFDGSSTGSNPYGSLSLASNGMLYGMTFQGGANNYGVLFEYDITSSTLTNKVDFDGTSKGRNPKGSLVQSSDQLLYGMTFSGGTNNSGVLFEFNPATSTCTKKLDLNIAPDGKSPYGSIVQSYNGKFYGMTYSGGTDGLGVLFEYDPGSSVYTKKVDFAGSSNGSYPYGSLIQASNGKLYGMTYSGGTNGTGVLFEYDPAGSTYTKKIDFDGATYGSNPFGSLVLANNGKLYGMTFQGGTSSKGVLFEYDPTTSIFTKKLDFTGSANGSNPYGQLMQASNGKLYGMTNLGGTSNKGVLFEYDPFTSAYTKKVDFSGTANGSNPYGSLIEASDGKLYGMTFLGGTSNYGVLFEFDPATSNFNKELDFTGTANGRNPYGSLILAPNGNLYGMTYQGGTNALGVIFEYNPSTNTYTKKLDFDGYNGSKPYYSRNSVVSTTTWTGSVSTDWSNSGNWSDGVPDAFSLATIPSVSNQPHITASVASPSVCKHLTIATGSRITVDAGKALTVSGVLTNNAGNFGTILKSDATGTGSLINYTPDIDSRVERFLTHSKWHFIGMPVETGEAGVFHLSSGHSDIYLRTHVESTNTWGEYIIPVETQLIQGRGYECWVGDPAGFSQDETIVFPGKLNAGNYTTGSGSFYTLEFTTDHGLNLICNPYPSALQANIHTWSKTNIANSVWTWDPSAGNYMYWNGTGGGGGGYGTLTDGIIPAMQSFFVLATASGPALTLPQTDQIHSSQAFYKESGIPLNTLRLDVNGNNYKDAIFIGFNSLASEEYDVDFDVEKIYGIDEAPQMYAHCGEKKLSIDALPEIGEDRIINLGFECATLSEFSITASGMEGFEEETEFWLEDVKEGIVHNLGDNPNYYFTNALSDDPNRFILHFGKPNSVVENRMEKIQIYSYNHWINIRNQSAGKMDVYVYDITGRLIIEDQYYSTGLVKIETRLETGYYVVKVLSDGEVSQAKVFVK